MPCKYTIVRKKCSFVQPRLRFRYIFVGLFLSVLTYKSGSLKFFATNRASHVDVQPQSKEYVAIMFHTDADAFEQPLLNLEPLIDELWAVRLFNPIRKDDPSSTEKLHTTALRVTQTQVALSLQNKGVHLEVHGHDITDLPREALTNSFALANHFTLSLTTYDSIPEEKILHIQQDVVFCHQHERSLVSFMHHKYVGAPWNSNLRTISLPDLNGNVLRLWYGNGGVSVRSKAFSQGCLRRVEYAADLNVSRYGAGLPEDVFFSRCLHEHHRHDIALEDASVFSAEEIIDAKKPTLAVHDPCRAANGPIVKNVSESVGCSTKEHIVTTKALLQRCPEAKRIIFECVKDCASLLF